MSHPQFEDLFFSWAEGFMTGLNLGLSSDRAQTTARHHSPEAFQRSLETAAMRP
jgi:hypothetical protein